jgi:phosphopantetheinyl transferase
MPLLFNKEHEDGEYQIAVWDTVEDTSFFLDKLKLNTQQLSNLDNMKPHRKREWLSSRMLLQHLLKTPDFILCKDECGKPFLKNSDLNISISHSNEKAAVIVSKHLVGIDIQRSEEKIIRIKQKFISENELATIDESHEHDSYQIFWGAKEAMYKGYGKRELNFNKHMHVYPFKCFKNQLELKGWVDKGASIQNYNIYTDRLDNYYLVFAVLNHQK